MTRVTRGERDGRLHTGRDVEAPIATLGGWTEFSCPLGVTAALERTVAAATDGRIGVEAIGPLSSEQVREVRMLRAFTPEPPISSRLPISYQVIPPALRGMLASFVGRLKRRSVESWAVFPRWPVDLSADLLADLAGETSPFAGKPAPVLLSHDLDSPEGLSNLVSHFMDIEEAVGARSANYIVPCAWPIDHAKLADVRDRGHEIGIHGYDHANLTPFASPDRQLFRLAAATDLIHRYGITGYRAPSLLRTRSLLDGLAQHYRYDSSIPTSGGLFPVPNNGCASARPFMIGGLPEIPLTLPRDGSLRFLGYGPKEILRIWRESADLVARSGGIVSLLTHCEARFSGNTAMLEAYRDFLSYLHGSDRFVFSSTAEVLHQAGLTNARFSDAAMIASHG